MSTKYLHFCDKCGKEIFTGQRMNRVNVTAYMDKADGSFDWNDDRSIDLCDECLEKSIPNIDALPFHQAG